MKDISKHFSSTPAEQMKGDSERSLMKFKREGHKTSQEYSRKFKALRKALKNKKM